jgi:hypothetical protein
MIKYLALLALLIISAPFWLPTSLGGDTSYHFVLTDSMKGTLDPGAFVVLRRGSHYQVGDAVGYRLSVGGGDHVTILHRIVSRQDDGKFVLKGDARESTEQVAPEAITGRMVFAVPALGFLPGAFRQSPLLLGGMLLGVVLLGGTVLQWARKPKSASKGAARRQPRQRENLFLPAALVILLALPFAGISMADLVPLVPPLGVEAILDKVPLFALLLGVLAATRFGEIIWVNNSLESVSASIAEINYVVAMILAVMVIPFPALIASARAVLTL